MGRFQEHETLPDTAEGADGRKPVVAGASVNAVASSGPERNDPRAIHDPGGSANREGSNSQVNDVRPLMAAASCVQPVVPDSRSGNHSGGSQAPRPRGDGIPPITPPGAANANDNNPLATL